MDCPGVVYPTASTPTECVLKGVVGFSFTYDRQKGVAGRMKMPNGKLAVDRKHAVQRYSTYT